MGFYTWQYDPARLGADADCRIDRAKPRQLWHQTGQILGACLIFWFCFGGGAVGADTLRLAIYNVDLSDRGPGLVLQSLQKGGSPAQTALVRNIIALDADILLLTGIDYDAEGKTLAALAAQLAQAGLAYAHQVALRPNSGVPTGFDLDGNGRLGDARDAMAYGRYPGEGGMALLSRLPIDTAQLRDFSAYLWSDLPRSLSPDTDPALRGIQCLSSGGHYEVPVILPNGTPLRLLAFYAGPPGFDGTDDRNGKRNHDEAAFWLHLLAGDLPYPPPSAPFVLMGQASLDPVDGGGRSAALRQLLDHPLLQDPRPRSTSGRVDAGQRGDAALDTVLYNGLGGLRVDYILPARAVTVAASGVMWPPDGGALATDLATAARHRPVWVDIIPPP
jgi:hypothetical protein